MQFINVYNKYRYCIILILCSVICLISIHILRIQYLRNKAKLLQKEMAFAQTELLRIARCLTHLYLNGDMPKIPNSQKYEIREISYCDLFPQFSGDSYIEGWCLKEMSFSDRFAKNSMLKYYYDDHSLAVISTGPSKDLINPEFMQHLLAETGTLRSAQSLRLISYDPTNGSESKGILFYYINTKIPNKLIEIDNIRYHRD